ncbi:MAG: FHA domain-containing protein [Pyrinomonadaceae bacterium]|jgi:hypothetical protein|nr:FHA domain-containing protein [Pyrinomonadaceae bacterium]
MITCGMCETENADSAQYCDECGAALTQTPHQHHDYLMRPLEAEAEDAAGGGRNGNGNSSSNQSTNGSASVVAEPAMRRAPAEVAPAQGAPLFARRSTNVSDSSLQQTSQCKLVIQRGHASGKEFFLNENETLIGRWDADGGIFPDVDLDTDDPEAKVSRRHARILRRGDEYFIEDLGSTNGTFVNRGRRLLPGDLQPLRDADEIIVGKTFLRLYLTK